MVTSNNDAAPNELCSVAIRVNVICIRVLISVVLLTYDAIEGFKASIVPCDTVYIRCCFYQVGVREVVGRCL